MVLKNQYRDYFEKLLIDILNMGQKVKEIIINTINTLKFMDFSIIDSNSILEYEIDKYERELESECMKILSLYHPVASDFRLVTGYLKFITDMERIADQCTDICEIISMKHINKNHEIISSVIEMFEMILDMFNRTIKIIKNPNVKEASDICAFDDKVDSMFSIIVYKICYMISNYNKDIKVPFNKNENVSPEIFAVVDLLFVTKYIERIGDHCTNISEWIIYVKTGMHPELN